VAERGAGLIEVELRPHWLNGWFLRTFARAYLRLDGVERPVEWDRPAVVAVPAGSHRADVCVRYGRWSASGAGPERAITVAVDERSRWVARNGAPFVLRPAGRP
jgi:hypothetical protein